MSNILERNKKNALDFYDLAFNQSRPVEAIREFVGDVYVQHNPTLRDGKKSFIDHFTQLAEDNPDKRIHFKRIVAEGDMVALHYHQDLPGSPGFAGIDIFRFDENGKIVEHWDVLQEVPKRSANRNSMF
jgi:predicted SnoaL-like aldol condensation-catalyzing enzyme